MSSKRAILEELEGISPLLAEIKLEARSPEVSEQYFREMQADVLWRIRQEEQLHVEAGHSPSEISGRASWWQSSLWVWISRPAVAIGMIALGVLVLPPLLQEKKSAQFSQLTAEETLDFIVEHAELFEPEELLSALPESSVWMETLPAQDEPAREELMDAIMETLDTEDLETLY